MRLLDESGPAALSVQKLSIERIAREAGVGTRTVYVAFGAKREILSVICERWLERAGARERARAVLETADPVARVRGAAGGVLVDEVLDHVAVEPLGHVPHVERDADHVGGAARVAHVLERAAAAGAGAVRARVGGQRQVHAGHVMAGLGHARGGHRRVDAARHGGQYTKPHIRRDYLCPRGRRAGRRRGRPRPRR